MTTAERALELANRLNGCERAELSMTACQDLESILRHYAEILPKYEAIMRQEAVITVEQEYDGDQTGVWLKPDEAKAFRKLLDGTQLIIKP